VRICLTAALIISANVNCEQTAQVSHWNLNNVNDL
jgi:hypothetical protein